MTSVITKEIGSVSNVGSVSRLMYTHDISNN